MSGKHLLSCFFTVLSQTLAVLFLPDTTAGFIGFRYFSEALAVFQICIYGSRTGSTLRAKCSTSRRVEQLDLFGRLGGDEFAIVLADAREADAAAVMDQLRLGVERSPRNGVRCTLSAGVEGMMPGNTLMSPG